MLLSYTMMQVDHTDEERTELEHFARLSDIKLEQCPNELLSQLLDIINSTTKRIPKRRQTSAQV